MDLFEFKASPGLQRQPELHNKILFKDSTTTKIHAVKNKTKRKKFLKEQIVHKYKEMWEGRVRGQ